MTKGSDKLDLNAASINHLMSIKGFGRGRAEAIVRYRGKNGPFATVDDIAKVPHLDDMAPEELDRAKQYLMVHTSGSSPENEAVDKINVNRANVAELRRAPGIGEAHADAIVAYRTEHGQIEDLTELDSLPHLCDLSELERRQIKKSLTV